MRFATICALLLLTLVLPPASAAQQSYVFVVDTTRSVIELDVSASPPGVTASADASSRLAGSVTAELTPPAAPFTGIHVTAMDLTLADDVFLRLDFGAIVGRLDISAPPHEVELTLIESGDPTVVEDTTFEQQATVFAIRGTLDLDATGFISIGVGDSTELDSELEFTLNGSITSADQTLRMIIPLDVVDTTDVGGIPLIISIGGAIVATAEEVGTHAHGPEQPSSFILRQNYPNPFNPSTTISFSLEQSRHVSLEVFDALGRRVSSLIDAVLSSGTHEATFDAPNLPSGVYLCRLTAGDETRQRTMVLLR